VHGDDLLILEGFNDDIANRFSTALIPAVQATN